MMNYRFLTTVTNLKALYIFRCLFTTLSVKLFVVTVQIFIYKFLFTTMFFGKRKNNGHETFHILKMKAHFTVLIWVLIVWPQIPQIPQKFICPICLPKPKSSGFQSSLGVRSPWMVAKRK